MQQPTPSMMSSFPPANITTEQIQKYLDENKKLILAIMDNQNLGKLAECAQYQAQLQKNLMYLAAIADSQPQMATVPPQMSPHPGVQQGAFYMQQQAAAMAQPQGVFSPRMAAQFTNPLQLQQQQQQRHNLHQQHQQAIPGQIHYRLTRPSSGMNPMQTEATVGGANSRASPASAGANKQDGPEGGLGVDGKGTSAAAAGHGGGGGGGEGDTSHRKSSEERK